MNPKGNIFLALGKRDVGKTYTTMEMAQRAQDRGKVQKSLLVYDHTNNSSYNQYDLTPVTIEQVMYELPYLRKPFRCIIHYDDIDHFCEVVNLYLSLCCIVFDDCGVLFRGNLTIPKEKLLKTPKNNGRELFFQAHRLSEISPSLLAAANMYIIKQTVEDFDKLPPKVICRRELKYLLEQCVEENAQRPAKQKWATRVYDTEEDEVWIPKVVDGQEDFEIISGEDYFPFSPKRQMQLKTLQELKARIQQQTRRSY